MFLNVKLTHEELEAVLGAVKQEDDEFGFHVGRVAYGTPEQHRASTEAGERLISYLEGCLN